MITLDKVTKKYYSLTALNNVSLRFPHGEVFGLLGPNGAGKTTMLKLLAGLISPTSGSLFPNGEGWPFVGYKPERLLFPNQLQVRKYLELMAGTSNIPRHDSERVVMESLARVNLLDSANKKIGHISKGMRQRLGLAQAILGDPPLLLLDEPANGLDPEGQVEIDTYIKELHAAGKTIVLSSHQLNEVTQVCTQLIILNRGQIHYQNSMAAALSLRPYVRIYTDKDLESLRPLLLSLHPGIEVEGEVVTLHNEAMQLRRHILTLLLNRNYDVLRVEQQRITLDEIYAEAIK
ncbi:MAG: ABC transporter ATP-binding protein [Anaerolineales bacterium]|nr:ABC transporter ATP-binding protein [Anaerolineales bacterium]